MAPSQTRPTISLHPSDSPPGADRKHLSRSLSPASCITDTRSCPELDGESCLVPAGDAGAKTRRKSAFSRSYTDLRGEVMPQPYGQNSKMKRVLMSGNVNSQKKLEVELQKLSKQKMKKAEELTLQKLDFLETAFKNSMAVAKGLQNDHKVLECGAGTPSRRELPLLSPARGSLVSESRCSTARARSTFGSAVSSLERQGKPQNPQLNGASHAMKFPRLPVPDVKSLSAQPQSPRPATTANLSKHNRRLLRQGETKHHLVESNMVSTIKHAGNLEAPSPPNQPSSTEDPPKMWSCVQDERFTRLQDSLVPMWQTSSWDERVKTNGLMDWKNPATGHDGRFKTFQDKRIRRRDTFRINVQNELNNSQTDS